MKTLTFDAIGTHWSVDIYDPLDKDVSLLEKLLKQRIASFENLYSRFRADSLVAEMAKKPGTYLLPENDIDMFRLYEKFYTLTGGSMTPLIGSVMEQSGYDRTYSLEPKELTAPPSWETTMRIEGAELVMLRAALIDIGALGKGALIDKIGNLLKEQGLRAYCIDAGGDILYKTNTENKLTVGLEHPTDTSKIIGTTQIRNQAIAGSAGNRRKWKNFHHIMDPHSLQPVSKVLASWVIADSAMLADALSTAVFFIDPAKLRSTYNFTYCLVYPDLTVAKADDFPGELFYN